MQIYAAYKFPDRDFAFGGQDAPQPLPVTSMSAGGFEHHVHTTFDSEEGGVQSEMIILHDAPLTAGVVPVIGSALRIAVQQELFRLFRRFAVLAQDAVDPELHIGMQEDVHAVGALTQDVVGTTADDHARLLFREVADQVVLNHIQSVRNRQGTAAGARRQRPVEEEGVGGFGIFAVLFDELFGQTAFSGDLRDEFLVIAGDASRSATSRPTVRPPLPNSRLMVIMRTGFMIRALSFEKPCEHNIRLTKRNYNRIFFNFFPERG